MCGGVYMEHVIVLHKDVSVQLDTALWTDFSLPHFHPISPLNCFLSTFMFYYTQDFIYLCKLQEAQMTTAHLICSDKQNPLGP